MKKLTPVQKKYLLKKSNDTVAIRTKKNASANRERSKKRGYCILIGPEHLSLVKSDPRKKLISFVKSVRRLILNGKVNIWIDFTHTEKVVADGMIYLYAEISQLRKRFPYIDIRSTAPRDKVVAQVFKKIGFSNLVKCRVPQGPEEKRKDVYSWLSAYGENVNGENCGNILSRYEGRIARSLSIELYKGMSEAMTNANQHAYIGNRRDGFDISMGTKPWWLFSQEVDGELTVVLCDLGVGIPDSLPKTKPNLIEALINLLGKRLTDSKLIKEAVVDSVTRTHKSYRGKGLRQIVKTVDSCDKGEMFILSNCGGYRYRSGGEIDTVDYSSSMCGTIVGWRVSLPEQMDLGVQEKGLECAY
ncbi:hypothetical protein [Vreelandella venusta]|uniref:hypothetical protein n=1 Tax=Vreelandella venusta TaxID=44935 RepID=UPI003AA9C171